MSTKIDIDELERLNAAAAPGLWHWKQSYETGDRQKHWAIGDPISDASKRVTSFHLVSLSRGRAHGELGFLDDPNVQLVVAARNALPALLEEVKQLRSSAAADAAMKEIGRLAVAKEDGNNLSDQKAYNAAIASFRSAAPAGTGEGGGNG